MKNAKNKSCGSVFRIKSCALSVMLACVVAVPFAPAYAFQFKNEAGDVTGSFDTTISAGTSIRVDSRDPSLVSIANGGTSRSNNEDDGNLNYNSGGAFSTVLKASHDLELKYKNYGLFARGAYLYDFQNIDKNELGREAKAQLGKDAQLLDAFVWGNFDVQGRPLKVRLGKQVVSWGESTFIGNGINIINPLDVSKLRAPGAELKEGLIPSPMVWASAGVTDKLTVEGFVLTQWDKTRIDPRGSYFSSNDYVSDDGDKVYVGFGRRYDQNLPLVPPVGGTAAVAQVWAPRGLDREASNGNQYGIAFRYLAESLNNTEFGFYHANYHSRTPIASGIRGTTSNSLAAGTASYFAEFPQNIKLFGMSFSTQGPAGIALQGEYSYRPNQPLQLASIEVLLAALGAANNITGGAAAAAAVPIGTEISGYRRVEMHQLQLTGTKAFGPTFGAEQLVVVGEVGHTWLNLPDGLLFNGPGTALPAIGSSTATSGGSNQLEGYATKSSWGYRLLGRLDFPNAIGSATVSPRIAFSHDVDGVSPTFNQGAKALTLGLGFNYKQNWQADIAYTSFFGGRTYAGTDTAGVPAGQTASYATSANPLIDRDFISVSVSYSF